MKRKRRSASILLWIGGACWAASACNTYGNAPNAGPQTLGGDAGFGSGAGSATSSGSPSGGLGGEGMSTTSMGGEPTAGAAGEIMAGAGGEAPAPATWCAGDVACDWVGVIGTGQSLSVGAKGDDLQDTEAPFGNLKLADSAPAPNFDYAKDPNGEGSTLSVAPLTDWVKPLICTGCAFSSDAYPNNVAGTTPHVAMANQLSELALAAGRADYVTTHSVVGSNGKAMDFLVKGSGSGNSYAAAMFEAHAFARLAKQAGKSFGYGAVVLTHGEADSGNVSPGTYEAALAKLQQDFSDDLVAITGQAQTVPLIVSQQHTFPSKTGSAFTAPATSGYPTTTQAMWRAGSDYPDQIIVAGPKYQYEYSSDLVHLKGAGYRRLGEKYAEVFYRVVEQQAPWKPLQPKSVARSGANEITITFDVPYPPLAWDATLVSHQSPGHPWAAGRGFEVLDVTGNPVKIVSADLDTASDQVKLQLNAAPQGALMVQYAMTQDTMSGFTGGTTQGRRGQLRDSDPFEPRDRQTITCDVSKGGALLKNCTPALLPGRGVGDLVDEADASLSAIGSATEATLSSAWSGASGTKALTIRSNQYNYCLAFSQLADDPALETDQRHDFNGDGHPDMMWRHGGTGANVIYTVVGTQRLKSYGIPDVKDLNWKIEGSANDFDGDGYADIVWRNYATGGIIIWQIENAVKKAQVDLPTVSDLDFHIETSADLNHDGSPDIVWRHGVTGQVVLWPMKGLTCSSFSGSLCAGTQLGFKVTDLDFHIRGAGDFDRDGNLDLVWHNTRDGSICIWYMNGTSLSRVTTIGDHAATDQQLSEVADFDGDGHPDLVFLDKGSTIPVVWLMQGERVLGKAELPKSTDPLWEVVAR